MIAALAAIVCLRRAQLGVGAKPGVYTHDLWVRFQDSDVTEANARAQPERNREDVSGRGSSIEHQRLMPGVEDRVLEIRTTHRR